MYPKLLTQLDIIPSEDLEHYAFICSTIHTHSNEKYHTANIHSDVFRRRVGGNYRMYIDNLIKWGVIEIQKNDAGNESYSNNPTNNFSKCYSLTINSIKSGMVVTTFKRRKSKQLTNVENIRLNDIQVSDSVINYTLNSISNILIHYISIDILPNICLNESTEKEYKKVILGESRLRNITNNNFSISYGENSGRLYHPIICCPKTLRNHIWYKDSDTVATYDIKSCFPVLLMKFVDPSEQEKYKSMLDDDIYNQINPDDRDDCKVEFQKFLNGFVSNYVYSWFINEFSKTFKYIEQHYKTMALNLQRTESDIMVKQLIPFIIEMGIKDIILCHDGWMSPNRGDDDKIISFVKERVYKACGYTPKIGHTSRKIEKDI